MSHNICTDSSPVTLTQRMTGSPDWTSLSASCLRRRMHNKQLSKIKNEYLNFGISYVISVLIGNFIQLDSSNLNVTPRMIILIVLNILMLIVWGWSGYNRGKRKAQKEIRASEQEYVQTVLQMDNRARSELYNLSRFIKKHPKECATIDKFGIDFVMTFIEDDKIIRKAMKE